MDEDRSRQAAMLLTVRAVALVLLSLVVALAALTAALSARAAGETGSTVFVPVVANLPPPTPSPLPEFVTLVPQPEAECPNDILASPYNDYVYVANNYSSNVTVLRDTSILATVATGDWPSNLSADPDSPRVFVTNLHDSVHILSGTQNIGQIPHYFEGLTPLFNPVNKYLYVTDLDSDIRVYDAADSMPTYITDLEVDDGVRGWIRGIDFDPVTGRVFVASWDYPELYIVEDAEIIAERNTGTWGTIDVLYDSSRGYVYLAGSEANARPTGFPANNLVVYNGRPPYNLLAEFATAPGGTFDLALDPFSGLVYATNPGDNTITVLNGTELLGTFPSGGLKPWAVDVNESTGYAFVTNRGSHSMTILRNGAILAVVETGGDDPFAVEANPRTGYTYVANRGLPDGIFSCEPSSIAIFR